MFALFTLLLLLLGSSLSLYTSCSFDAVLITEGAKLNVEMSSTADMHQYFSMYRYMRKVMNDPEF
ncbi:hypothetical protein PRIPAC_93789 [Pristionchus pacificus]|uniref:Uncharacterized protein n=1 Tax=Pristionchus pacificus TaxID=54126 RepID=A0A454XPW3_PRIPA|nr:hypothetical protein PRIPAC_93789 [Pristionchus pacificus]|eukprot:PDM67626.1 hypothetical protein PRIPAC_45670 [Pristionchus pacificus]